MFGFVIVAGFATPAQAALFDAAKGEACKGANLDSANATCDEGKDASGQTALDRGVKTAVNILTAIVGIAAVIMIIINGLRFITANGDSGSISSARTGIIYALVGLVVAAMAQIIVRFILNRF